MEISTKKHNLMETKFSATTIGSTSTHSVLQITLSGPSLLFTIVGLIVSICVFDTTCSATLIALAPLPFIITNDFRAFLSLGPGGTPSTFCGYLKITYLRLFALSDPFKPPMILDLASICPQRGSFERASSWLPLRQGTRPTVSGIAPQRQIDQYGCPKVHLVFRDILTRCAEENPTVLRVGSSCFEKQGLALFARSPINTTCNGEICHVHASDKSLHLNLHPADAKVVLESGWGQRHPLARGGWLGRYVPREFLMVYAPRDEEELRVVSRIVEAAAWWVTAQTVTLVTDKE